MKILRSTRVQAALITSGLLLTVIVARDIATYHELRATAVASARERLTVVSDELGDMIELTTDRVREHVGDLANDRAVIAYLRNPSTEAESAALLALNRAGPAGLAIGVELRNAAGRRLLATARGLPGSIDREMPELAGTEEGVIGNLTVFGDSLAYPAIGAVKDGEETVGYLIRWHRMANSERTLEQVRDLIGPGANVYLANTRGDIWTDLNQRVEAPPIDLVGTRTPALESEASARDELDGLAAGAQVEGTPWTLVVAFPFDVVLAPARAMIPWQIATGLLLLLVTVGTAWLLIGRLTGSLTELANAAGSIREGDYSRRAVIGGADEVRVVGHAFNSMAENVESTRRQLEDQLDEIAAAHRAIQETTERLEHLIASSRAVIYKLDVSGSEVILEWISGNVTSILGFSPAQALTPGWWARNLHPDDHGLLNPSPNRFRTEVIRQEYRLRDAAGEYRWIQDEQRPIARPGEDRIEVIGTFIDVTDRRKLELARDAAEVASQAKSEFLSRMSHELRTPMNAILGFSQLLEMEVEEPENRESVRQILNGGRHLLKLINEVLDLARIEAGGVAIAMEAVELQPVVSEATELLRGLAGQASVTLVAEETDLCVLADQQRLTQVILNLVSNAINYNRQGGSIEVTCRTTAEGKIRIAVRDTGKGLTPSELARLFTPFDRLGAADDGVRGTGLGLVLSRGLVEAMEGTMGVESVAGEGSTFWLELHTAETHAEPREADVVASAPPPLDQDSKTLLYIEDNVSNIDLIHRIFRLLPNLRIIPAMQGSLGLQLAREHRPDLIMLDVNLPDMFGNDVLSELQQDLDLRSIPVIVISADATAKQIENLLQAGAHAYVTKPFDVQHLKSVVANALFPMNS